VISSETEVVLSPIAEGLFIQEDNGVVRLLASRCVSCESLTFPTQPTCPRCFAVEVKTVPLSSRGRLWSWTVQSFRPTSPPYEGPAEFEPFGVGYLEIDGLCVEGRLDLPPDGQPQIGASMETYAARFEGAVPALTYAFRSSGGDA
jgi:uncharacterized OB-fold protein